MIKSCAAVSSEQQCSESIGHVSTDKQVKAMQQAVAVVAARYHEAVDVTSVMAITVGRD